MSADNHPSGHSSISDRDHTHDYRGTSKRALLIVLGLLVTHMIIEVVGSIMSGSLGLLAHATHMLTDAVAISLALFAMWIAERPSTITRTYGYHRAEVLVVLFNALALWVLATGIAYEAYLRISDHAHGHDHEVDGAIMVIVALIGLAIHLFAAWVLRRSSRHSINLEGVFWHILADMLGGIALIVSGFLELFLALIHRRAACRRPAEETEGCASESGIMVLKQKTGPRKGAPDR